MPKKIGGKLVYTEEEQQQMGLPSPEEIARNQAILDQWQAQRAAAPPAPEGTTPGFGGRFSNDHEGTDWEGWTVDPATGRWLDQHGNPVDEGPQQ